MKHVLFDENGLKVCSKCKVPKTAEEFWVARDTASGRNLCCKDCLKERNQTSEHKQYMKAYQHEYQKTRVHTPEQKIRRAQNQKRWLLEHPEEYMLYDARRRAKDTGLPCDLTREDVIVPNVCPVLGIPIYRNGEVRSDNSPSIDKVHPHLGYIASNVGIISWRANHIKNNGTSSEHRLIARWMKEKESISLVEQNPFPGDGERTLLGHARSRAREKKVPFSISAKDIVIPDVCPILGIKLKSGRRIAEDGSPSLDRLKPELGYIKGNIAVISRRANVLKGFGTAEEHLLVADWIDRFPLSGEERVA